MDDLVKRVQHIEEELKRVKRSRAIWLTLSAGILLMAFQAPSSAPEVVEARGFRLVDDDGRLRGMWGPNREGGRLGTSLSIWDWRGGGPSEVVKIQSYEGRGELELKGGGNDGMIGLSAVDGGSRLRLYTQRTTSKGGINNYPMVKIDALPDHGRIELMEAKFEESAEGALSVEDKCVFHVPERK